MKFNKDKIILQLLKNITEYNDLDDALLKTLSQLKINEDKYYEIKKGFSSKWTFFINE